MVRASAGARPLDRPSEDEAEHRGGDGDAVAPEEAHQGTGHGGREPGGAAEAVELATLEWVHWYNHRHLFGPLGHVPPAAFEAHYYHQLQGSAMAA